MTAEMPPWPPESARRFRPEEIFPKDGVRVNGTALRDWQQSVAAGRESTLHMSNVAPQLDQYHASLANHFPGAEEAGGGTVPRMDMSVRDEDPFAHVAKLKALMPHTPLMALIRSDAGAGMEEVAPDVLETYLLNYHKAGIDVFRNFHALNDPRAFVRVAKILHKTGEANGTPAHFQAAFSYATDGQNGADGTGVYNSRTPVSFFKKLVQVLREEAARDGAANSDAYLPHSFVIKDPSGVLTPEMATLITSAVKAAQAAGELPNIPFGIHTHNQMGHAAQTCEAAAKAGANFVDCAPEPGGLGAQPPMQAMVKALGGDDGKELGFADQESFDAAKAKLTVVDKMSAAILKSHDPDVRQNDPDPSVPSHCIAGGQASVARAEVKAMLQKRRPADVAVTADEITKFMNKIKARMPEVRKELGMPCLVTPTADYIFREAARRENGGDPNKDFYCGYRRIINGEMGPTKEKVDPEKQKQALLERILVRFPRTVTDTVRFGEIKTSGALEELRDVMLEYSRPVRDQQRFEELNDRLAEIEALGSKPANLAELKQERDELAKDTTRPEAIERYNAFLKARTEDLTAQVNAGEFNPLVERYKEILEKTDKLRALDLPAESNIRLIKSASYTSLPIAELFPPGMDPARQELKRLAAAGQYITPSDSARFDLDAALGRMLRDPHAQVPDKIPGDFFQRRDGLAPPLQGDRGKASFEALAKFNEPVSAARLQQKLSDALVANERWDSAVNFQLLPATKGAQESNKFTVHIDRVDDPARVGFKVMQDVVRTLSREDPAEPVADLSKAPDGDLGGTLGKSHAHAALQAAAASERVRRISV